jgi:hypothetical protein
MFLENNVSQSPKRHNSGYEKLRTDLSQIDIATCDALKGGIGAYLVSTLPLLMIFAIFSTNRIASAYLNMRIVKAGCSMVSLLSLLL